MVWWPCQLRSFLPFQRLHEWVLMVAATRTPVIVRLTALGLVGSEPANDHEPVDRRRCAAGLFLIAD